METVEKLVFVVEDGGRTINRSVTRRLVREIAAWLKDGNDGTPLAITVDPGVRLQILVADQAVLKKWDGSTISVLTRDGEWEGDLKEELDGPT